MVGRSLYDIHHNKLNTPSSAEYCLFAYAFCYTVKMNMKQKGFTIVELATVIAVIAILATISAVVYSGVQERGRYSKAQTDMKHLNDAITIYRSKTSAYPGTATAGCQDILATTTTYAAPLNVIVPNYLDKTVAPPNTTGSVYKYCWTANGANYKILRFIPSANGGLPTVEKTNNPYLNTTGAYAGTASVRLSWGYWSDGGQSI